MCVPFEGQPSGFLRRIRTILPFFFESFAPGTFPGSWPGLFALSSACDNRANRNNQAETKGGKMKLFRGCLRPPCCLWYRGKNVFSPSVNTESFWGIFMVCARYALNAFLFVFVYAFCLFYDFFLLVGVKLLNFLLRMCFEDLEHFRFWKLFERLFFIFCVNCIRFIVKVCYLHPIFLWKIYDLFFETELLKNGKLFK